jgi:hypothetical protein
VGRCACQGAPPWALAIPLRVQNNCPFATPGPPTLKFVCTVPQLLNNYLSTIPGGNKIRARPITPPNSLKQEEGRHAQTPQKSAIFAVKLFCQIRGIKGLSTAKLQQITSVNPRAQRYLFRTRECRTKHN